MPLLDSKRLLKRNRLSSLDFLHGFGYQLVPLLLCRLGEELLPPTPDETIQEIERLAGETDLSIRRIKKALSEDVSRGVVGRVVKEVRSEG